MGGPDAPAPSAKLPPRPRRRPRPAPYLPPFRQRRLDAKQGQASTTDVAAQSRNWTRMKKHINGIINRVNQHNVARCALDLFRVNIVRERGVLCKALLRAQLASPSLSPVFAALVAVIGSRMPFLAELIIRRLVAQLNAAYTNQDRVLCFATARFIAQLFNQQVVNELLLLEFLSTIMLDPSDGSIELTVVILTECAVLLMEKSPRIMEGVFQKIRQLLHDGDLSKRAQVMIEKLMQLRRTKFGDADVLEPHLDMLEEEDIITHFVSLEDEDEFDLQYEHDEFQFDPEFEANEKEYELIKREILGAAVRLPPKDGSSDHFGRQGEPNGENLGGSEGLGGKNQTLTEKPIDMTESELVDFRRTIYLTFNSGISYEEWAHKLLRLMESNKGKEVECCQMVIECCSQEKTYMRPYGLLGQRLCEVNRLYRTVFEDLFANDFATIHLFDTRKIRNIANFFASLLASDVLPWSIFEVVRVVEEETTALSRIFLKILFQEIFRTLGESGAKKRFKLAEKEGNLDGVFPSDSVENTRFSINFFTSIGLGFLTDDLREKLRTAPNVPSNPRDDDDGSSSPLLSSGSDSSSVVSPSSGDEGTEKHPSRKPEPSSMNQDRDRTSQGDKRRGRQEKETRIDRERQIALHGREVSVKGSPQVSSFHNEKGGSYAAIEDSHLAYMNASSVTGAKRVAQRHADDREDQTHAMKRRRHGSPEQRSHHRRERVSPRDSLDRRYSSSSEDEKRETIRDGSSRYTRLRNPAERDSKKKYGRSRKDNESVRRESGSPYRRSRSRSANSHERRRHRHRYRERSDSDSLGESFKRERSRVRSSRPSRYESGPDVSDDRLSLRSRSRSRDRYHNRLGHNRLSRPATGSESGGERYGRGLSRERGELRATGYSSPSVQCSPAPAEK